MGLVEQHGLRTRRGSAPLEAGGFASALPQNGRVSASEPSHTRYSVQPWRALGGARLTSFVLLALLEGTGASDSTPSGPIDLRTRSGVKPRQGG